MQNIIQYPKGFTPFAHQREIYLAGGCFWGTQWYLNAIEGVLYTDVGYANGHTDSPTYDDVCHSDTGFAEAVRVIYDPSVVSLPFLLSLYFQSVDPVAVNRQGGDVGEQYRTGIYYVDAQDEPVIQAEIKKLQKGLSRPVAIEVKPLDNYYLAEAYHQGYLEANPRGYCHISPALREMAKNAREERGE